MLENQCQNCISFRAGDDEMYGVCERLNTQKHAGNICEWFISIEGDWRCKHCRHREEGVFTWRGQKYLGTWVDGRVLFRDEYGRNTVIRCRCKIDYERFMQSENERERQEKAKFKKETTGNQKQRWGERKKTYQQKTPVAKQISTATEDSFSEWKP
jgi:hypothetical protein